jgi:Rrf2 family nitric oxide-sensitive transcriptional repressor
MRLTRYTDYALRVLIHLALEGDALATIQAIADRYQISKNHLTKVVHELQKSGYVDTVRGKHGGLRLRLAPHEVNIGKLVRETERELAIVECFGADNRCVITPHCALRSVLGEALDAFLHTLDRYTLADLLRRPGALRRVLGIAAPARDS